jgi:hypothetical protein
MSDYAVTPETYAAWRYLELDDELRPYDQERVEIERGGEELELLLSGMKRSSLSRSKVLTLDRPLVDLERFPTVEKIELFFKRGLEIKCFTQRSLARSLDRYRCQNICLAELEARPEAYPCFGTADEIRRQVVKIRRRDVELAQVAAEVEKDQRHQAENESLLASINGLIARRRASEHDDEDELCVSSG